MFVNKGVKVRGLVAEASLTGFIPDIQISKLTKYFLKVDFQNNSFDFFENKNAFSSTLSLKKYQNLAKYWFLKSSTNKKGLCLCLEQKIAKMSL